MSSKKKTEKMSPRKACICEYVVCTLNKTHQRNGTRQTYNILTRKAGEAADKKL